MPQIDKTYIANRLAALGIDAQVLQHYQQNHRHYHTLNHIEDVLKAIEQSGGLENDILFLAAVFHDIVYNPIVIDNEQQSAAYFRQVYKGDEGIAKQVEAIILDTKHHNGGTELSQQFQQADLAVLDRPLEGLIEYEHQIFKEFAFVDWKIYQTERIKILERFNTNGKLDGLIAYIKTSQPKIGVYAGSFNPFHKGHFNILQKAEQIFDKVIIAFGRNLEKNDAQWPRPTFLQYKQTEEYNGLITDFIKGLGYDVTLVRGLRNADDLQFEKKQYRYMQDFMPEIQHINIFCDVEFEHISSTSIRVLEKYGKHKEYLVDEE